MIETINEFESSKQQARTLLEKLVTFLQLGVDAGADIDANLTAKLEHALSTVDQGKLKIALVGGFSEGKTSIAAAWMEKLDSESMNISHQESSDAVKVYDLDDNCELIDTPGLFGFKEKLNADSSQIEMYKDITKKYVSEAHLVLYVMNSTNPIKASHHDDLNWLFRDLKLLSRTVFVLSRFDEVADVESEWDYRTNLEIKQQNVIERLNDAITLTEEELITVVAVAANPFDMGTEYWLENVEKFKALSHIEKLQQATVEKVRENGGQMSVALEAKNSIIRDVLGRQLPKAVENDEKIGEELARLNTMNIRLEKQISLANTRIIEVQIGLRNFVINYFGDLIIQVKGTDLNTFNDFFEREVGNEGVMLNTRVQNEIESQINALSGELTQLQNNFQNEVKHYNDTVMLMGKQGVNYLVKGSFINNQSILAARDGLSAAGKMVGIDLAGMLKFKPWGAVNLAKGINGALAFVGVALEAWNSWNEHKRQQAFEVAITEMVDNFEGQRKELLALINSGSFIANFFPSQISLISSMDDLCQCISQQTAKRAKFKQWREQGEIIEAEFSVV
ncbi:labile enterotoxin output A [Shewanella sp. Choline-02u-19]|uniref:LeoA/HP0731 family dynamin-like GTPase n=1 Tax=unclassified Shewanella TaxID=196818 RepID=UPI000C31F435|nr:MULTISPECIES: LeoA/HP0731 family dynamin-like GTPase [unclassified Shewanella]PKH56332.1 labile enterotoxin output A [Shewanella sp. Bg11-22]PKI27574.1 labile enterotoxin output A [Shewanella sp. Choline-02u-19]